MAIFDLRDLIVSLDSEICNGTKPVCEPTKPMCNGTKPMPAPACNASKPAVQRCNASKPAIQTNIFMCNGSKLVTCLGYADEGDLSTLRAQLIDTLFLVQRREDDLREMGSDGPVVPATPAELAVLEARLLEAVQKIREQKEGET